MEALLNYSAHTQAKGHNRFRTGLVLGGIVVAMVAFVLLMQDTAAAPWRMWGVHSIGAMPVR